MAVAGFQIGIEIELFLSFKEALRNTGPGLDKAAFAAALTTSYNKRKSPSQPVMTVDLSGVKGKTRNEWTLTDDNTIKLDKGKLNLYSLEIVSPVLEYKADFPWSRAVTQLWDCLIMDCDVETNDTCGTHVHISPLNNTPWDIQSVKAVCRSIIHFEGAFEAILPPSRRKNWVCQNNRLGSPSLTDRSDQECYRKIEDCPDTPSLIGVMQPGENPFRAWNFLNLRPDRFGTIEFRQAPGVTDSSGCHSWVELAVRFVQSAIQHGSVESLQMYAGSVEGLKIFLDAAFDPALNQRELLTSIFENKNGSLEPDCDDSDRVEPDSS
ncbi:hypothetical protein MMC17_007421 [Xylographa soralifera]|nr:hypothetical protein [Xylographa soralifera]